MRGSGERSRRAARGCAVYLAHEILHCGRREVLDADPAHVVDEDHAVALRLDLLQRVEHHLGGASRDAWLRQSDGTHGRPGAVALVSTLKRGAVATKRPMSCGLLSFGLWNLYAEGKRGAAKWDQNET